MGVSGLRPYHHVRVEPEECGWKVERGDGGDCSSAGFTPRERIWWLSSPARVLSSLHRPNQVARRRRSFGSRGVVRVVAAFAKSKAGPDRSICMLPKVPTAASDARRVQRCNICRSRRQRRRAPLWLRWHGRSDGTLPLDSGVSLAYSSERGGGHTLLVIRGHGPDKVERAVRGGVLRTSTACARPVSGSRWQQQWLCLRS